MDASDGDRSSSSSSSSLKFSLYIKASAIDKKFPGADPICQQFSMLTRLLGEQHEEMEFQVFTLDADAPPKDVLPDDWSKNFPFVTVSSGVDKNGRDISGSKYDTFEELERFFESVNTKCPELKRRNRPNQSSMAVIEDLFIAFNRYIRGQPETGLVTELKRLDRYLKKNGSTKYLVDDVLSFADCHLLPRLQHIRVAGKAYRQFEIPKELKSLWRYLAIAYEHSAIKATTPSDQDILYFYENKAKTRAVSFRRSWKLDELKYSIEVPEECLVSLPSPEVKEYVCEDQTLNGPTFEKLRNDLRERDTT